MGSLCVLISPPSLNPKGTVVCHHEYAIATAGQPLTPEQAHLLKLLLIPIAEFRFVMLAQWHEGTVKTLVEQSSDEAAAARRRAVKAAASASNGQGNDDDDEGDNEDQEDDDGEMD